MVCLPYYSHPFFFSGTVFPNADWVVFYCTSSTHSLCTTERKYQIVPALSEAVFYWEEWINRTELFLQTNSRLWLWLQGFQGHLPTVACVLHEHFSRSFAPCVCVCLCLLLFFIMCLFWFILYPPAVVITVLVEPETVCTQLVITSDLNFSIETVVFGKNWCYIKETTWWKGRAISDSVIYLYEAVFSLHST